MLKLHRADAKEAAALFGEEWGSGTLDGTAKIRLAGFTVRQLTGSANGTFHAEWTGHTEEAGDPPTALATPTIFSHFDSWISDGTIANRALELNSSLLNATPPRARGPARRRSSKASLADAGSPAMPLTGSITFARELSLHGPPGEDAVNVAGTMAHPLVMPRSASAKATPPAPRRPR